MNHETPYLTFYNDPSFGNVFVSTPQALVVDIVRKLLNQILEAYSQGAFHIKTP